MKKKKKKLYNVDGREPVRGSASESWPPSLYTAEDATAGLKVDGKEQNGDISAKERVEET